MSMHIQFVRFGLILVLARAGSAGGIPWIKGPLAGGFPSRLTSRVHPPLLASSLVKSPSIYGLVPFPLEPLDRFRTGYAEPPTPP